MFAKGYRMQNQLKICTTFAVIVFVTCLSYLCRLPEHVNYFYYDKPPVLNQSVARTLLHQDDNSSVLQSMSLAVTSTPTKALIHTHNTTYDNIDTKCPDVLKYMTYGKWETRKVSREEEKEMEIFLLKTRNQYAIPASLQRKDGKCGNTSFENLKLSWFRPLCDPKGSSPCCYNGACADVSVKNCVCKNCYDMRSVINAEHANWVPSQRQCQLPSRTGHQLCRFIDGLTIYFLGDSFVRHIFLVFVLLLRDNLVDGAMKSYTSKVMHDACSGYYMFTEKQCRAILVARPFVCGSRVKLDYIEFASSKKGDQLQRFMLSLNDPKVYFVVGTGVHDDFNTTNIWNRMLLPVLQQWKMSSLNPRRLLWHAAHAPGLMKTPFVPTQGYDRATEFNKEMNVLLQQYNVPIFESFNFTDGVNSFDGAHFGQGVNVLKARIIFEYFRELRENGRL